MHLLTRLRRARPAAAAGTAVALLTASGALAAPSSAEDLNWATVTGHEAHSPTNNRIATWCGVDESGKPNGIKLESGLSSPYQLPAEYSPYGKVVVKAASNNVTAPNTIFGQPPTAGQWVWADTDGDGIPEVGGDDKDSISHIIICRGTQPPPTTSLKVTKDWAAEDEDDAEYAASLTSENAGTLGIKVAGEPVEDAAWDQEITGLPIGAEADVTEGDDFTLPAREGYTCRVVDTAFDPASPVELNEKPTVVVVTNTVDCTKNPPPPTTSLQVTKEWAYGTGVPEGYTLTDADAGDLEVIVDDKATGQDWNDVKEGLPIEGSTLVTEGKVPDPKDPQGFTCTVQGSPEYKVNGGEWAEKAKFNLSADPNTVVVRNTVDCTKVVVPPTTSLTVTKEWAYVGAPAGWTLTSANAGPLTVTVNGQTTGQAWGATTSPLPVGATATVTEGGVPDPADPANYSCTITGSPEYAVNGAAFTTTAPQFALAATPNTVVVRNTVTCQTLTTGGEVGGVEDGTEDGSEDKVVDAAEDELADTGADFGPAGLGALLVLTGAALIAARRRAAA